MSGDRFQKVKQALLRARELNGDERERFLQALEPGIRQELESLLEHEARPARLVETGALADGLGADLAPALEQFRQGSLPDRIGPYDILEVLGEGGMGVVYRAEQTAPIQRDVALKLIKRGLDTDRVVARFESERQSLALMDHPNIARVFDAGADESGRPFFVMELVQGDPITVYCDQRRMTPRRRLELFLNVCDAVQHAHQKGVIHRDLKPSNILIVERDGKPVPKVIDFGIAKAVESTDEDAALTQAGQIVGTPDYMSPEQAGGPGRLDVRSDVYSLGVILYELLAGYRPYDFGSLDTHTMQRVVIETEPDRPSTRLDRARSEASTGEEIAAVGTRRSISVDKLRRLLTGDLDNIVLMALRKDPDRRYPSVERFATDVRRHLDGHPVTARADTWAYRSGKFVRRHRLGVSAAATFLALLLGFAITMAVQTARVAEQRNRAVAAEERAQSEAERARAEAETAVSVTDFLVSIFRVTNPSESLGNTITAREILDEGSTQVGDLEDPVVRARLEYVLGEVYHSLGLHEPAEKHIRESLTLRETRVANEELAQTFTMLSTVMHDRGQYEESIVLQRRAIELRKQLGLENEALAMDLNYLGVTLNAQEKLDEAESYLREALELNRRLRGDRDPEVAWSLSTLGHLVVKQGNLDEGLAMFREALSIQRESLGDVHPDVGSTLNNLGSTLRLAGDLEGAQPVLEEALAVYEQLYGREHAAVGRGKHNLATVLRLRGEAQRAEELFRDALWINETLLGPDHPYVAITSVGVATALLDAGDYDEASELVERALGIARATFGEDSPHVGSYLHDLGRVRLERGDPAAARAPLEKCLTLVSGSNAMDAKLTLGQTLVALGELESARTLLREVVDHRQQSLPDSHWQRGEAAAALAMCLVAQGEAPNAEPLLADCYARYRDVFGESHDRTREVAERLAELYESLGRPDDAGLYRRRAGEAG